MNLRKQFFSNILFAFSSQLISLLASLLLSIIVPKFLTIEDYSYWQLFVFYSNFISLAQLGVVDGVFLTFGGKDIEKLDYTSLGSEFYLFILFEFVVSLSCILLAYSFDGFSPKFYVFVFIAVYNIVYNSSRFLGFLFQAVNNTKWFSIALIIDRLVVLILGSLAIITNQVHWKFFVIIYIVGMTVSLAYTFFKGKRIVFCKEKYPIKKTIPILFQHARIGSFLMLSNLASNLILGIGRQGIELHWGILVFGKVSFALSITSFVLVFVNQVSLVLFPALKKIDSSLSESIFKAIDYTFSVLSPLLYIFYVPLSYFLGIWLPQYKESLLYLMFFMPVCVFDGKFQLLYSTFYKVLRKERLLFFVNFLCVLCSLISSFISILILDNLYVLIISMISVIAIRTFVSYCIFCSIYNNRVSFFPFLDIFFALLFISMNLLFSSIISEFVLVVVSGILVFSQRKKLSFVFSNFLGIRKKNCI